MVLGIFITHNTNFPCLTHFASSNEIIDRYKNKDADEDENLFMLQDYVEGRRGAGAWRAKAEGK